MRRSIESEVIVYHDETKSAGTEISKGHALLFVPIKTIIEETGDLFDTQIRQVEPLNILFEEIKKIRSDFGVDHKFHFSEISGRKWAKRNNADKQIVQIGVKYLKQNKTFCKLGIIFHEKPRPDQIASYGGKDRNERELRFGETLLRMLLKGTVHYLYDNSHKVKILKIITDGQPHHRRLNEFRILDRLTGEVREYVQIPKDAELVHLNSNHRNYNEGSEEYKHANMLQLADMLLGCAIHCCLKDAKIKNINPQIGNPIEDKKGIIAYPVKEMLDKRKRGSGFKNSSHYRAFTISKALIPNTGWEFENITTRKIEISNAGQLSIFDILEFKK
ncbi:MAG: hypothetical protein AB1410_09880 [Acidobacteriota bacterium]